MGATSTEPQHLRRHDERKSRAYDRTLDDNANDKYRQIR